MTNINYVISIDILIKIKMECFNNFVGFFP